MKKAFLYSIILIMLAAPLFYFTMFQLAAAKSTQSQNTQLNNPLIIRGVEQNYAQNLMDLYGIALLNITENSTTRTLIFTNLTTLSSTQNPLNNIHILQDYYQYVLANLSHLSINFTGDQTLYFTPYNLTLTINSTKVLFLWENTTALQSAQIYITTPELRNLTNYVPNDDGLSHPAIHMVISRGDNQEVFNQTIHLNPDEANAPLYQTFNLTTMVGNISVEYTKESANTILRISSNNLTSLITSLRLDLQQSPSFQITTGTNITLQLPQGLKKTSQVVWYQK